MTQHTLPEDYNQWPRNHYHLLGVSYGCDEHEIRRVYIRLIRKFKPDAFPEHFQRIRAAYEQVYAESKRYSSDEKKRLAPENHVGDTEAPPKSDDMVSPNLPRQQQPAPSTIPTKPEGPKEPVQHHSDQPRPDQSRPNFDEEMRNAWKLIEADKPHESYTQLVNLQKRTDSPVAGQVTKSAQCGCTAFSVSR